MKGMGIHYLGQLVWSMLQQHPDVTIGIKENKLHIITDEKLREIELGKYASITLKGMVNKYKRKERIFYKNPKVGTCIYQER